MGVKIKHRDPKTTDFSRDDVVINFNEGSLFFKSKLGLHKVTATQVNVGSENNIIGIGGPDEVLFNNGGVIGGDIGFRIRPYSLTTVGGIGYSQTSGGTFADDNVLDVDLPFITRKGMFFGIGSNPTENVLSGGSYLGLDQRVAIGGARGTIPNVGNIFQTGEMCLMIKNGTGHLILGPQEGNISSAYGLACHYETDRNSHMFNKPIVTMGNMISSFTNPLITTSQPLYITTDTSTSTGMGHAFIEVSNTTSGLPPHVKVYGNLSVEVNGTAPGIVYANQLHANGTDSRVVVLRSEIAGKAIKTTLWGS